MVVLGVLGVAYGAYIVYHGIELPGKINEAPGELVHSLGLSLRDGTRAMILLGSVLILYYLLIFSSGMLGIFCSRKKINSRKLFWIVIFLIAACFLFVTGGLLTLLEGIFTFVVLVLFVAGIYQRFDKKLKNFKTK